MPKTNQSAPFAADTEPDLFGAPERPAYKPEAAYVRNRLEALVTQMTSSETWPWDESVIALHRERTFDCLCGLLPADEAEDWRRRIAAEAARLDEAMRGSAA